MSSVSDILSASSTTAATSGKSAQALNSQDFLKILITELTSQDPFEPMKNQDLLNQVSSIQQIESSQTMTSSLNSMTGKFDSLIGQMGTFLDSQNSTLSSLDKFMTQQKLTTASQLIGKTISGTDAEGKAVSGMVTSVSITDGQILLTLDNGKQINMNDMAKLEPTAAATDDTVTLGTVMKGTLNGQTVVGTVESISIDNNKVMLNLKTKEQEMDGSVSDKIVQVPLSDAAALNVGTVGELIGQYVEGFVGGEGESSAQNRVMGIVRSYNITQDGIVLTLDTGESLPLTGLTTINASGQS
jgi:flagellar basal-body rod modification protein FlgD